MQKPWYMVKDTSGYFKFHEDGKTISIVGIKDACQFQDFGILCNILDSISWLSKDNYEIIAVRG